MKQLQDALDQGQFFLNFDATDIVSAYNPVVRRVVAEGMLTEQVSKAVTNERTQKRSSP